MYLIIVDGADFAISNNPTTCILDGQVHTKKNAIDTLEMTLAPNHPNDSLIELRKSIIEVRVGSSVAELRNTNSTVFVGIPVDVTEDFYKQKTYTFEGWMSLLSQTIQPYIAYQKSGNGGTPWTTGDILNNLLANHNGQLDGSNKYDFELVDAPAGIDNFGMTTADGCTTLEAISMLLDGNGGYLHATYDSTATKPFKLAWMDDDSAIRTNTQKIEFGSNLLDLSKQLDRVKPYTAVAPLTVTGIEGTIGKGKGKTQVKYGLKMYYDSASPRPADLKKLSAKDSGHSLTSDYKRDLYYVCDDDAVAEYGLNIFIYEYDDIDVESLADIMASGEKMYKRAKKKLKKLLKKGVDNIYLKATTIDLSITGANVPAIKLYDSVTMTSTPHGISQVAMITERDYDLCNPENDTIVFGEDSSSTITSVSTTPSKSVTKYVNQKINDIATTIEEGGGDGKDEVSDGHITSNDTVFEDVTGQPLSAEMDKVYAEINSDVLDIKDITLFNQLKTGNPFCRSVKKETYQWKTHTNGLHWGTYNYIDSNGESVTATLQDERDMNCSVSQTVETLPDDDALFLMITKSNGTKKLLSACVVRDASGYPLRISTKSGDMRNVQLQRAQDDSNYNGLIGAYSWKWVDTGQGGLDRTGYEYAPVKPAYDPTRHQSWNLTGSIECDFFETETTDTTNYANWGERERIEKTFTRVGTILELPDITGTEQEHEICKVNRGIDLYHYADDLSKYLKVNRAGDMEFKTLADVALTGKYEDLIDAPKVPNLTSELVNDANFVDANTDKLANYLTIQQIKGTIYDKTETYSKAEVDALTQDINHYQGTISALSGLSTNAKKGWFYRVDTAWATNLHVGDVIIAEKDNPAQTIDGANWSLLHNEMDTDTTYTFTGGTNSFSVTPSGGTTQTVQVTPSIANATQSKAGLMSASDKQKLDNSVDTDTTYTFAGGTNEFTVTPSGGSPQTVQVTPELPATGSVSSPIYLDSSGSPKVVQTFKTSTGGVTWTEYKTSQIVNHNPVKEYTYYFPVDSGTLALTSDIPDVTQYLPLSGGTMTGNIRLDGYKIYNSVTDDTHEPIATARSKSGNIIDYMELSDQALEFDHTDANKKKTRAIYDNYGFYFEDSDGNSFMSRFPRNKSGILALTSDIPDISGLATKDEVEDVELHQTELKMLGWTVPDGMSLKNEIDGNNFVQKVGRVDLSQLSNWGKSSATTSDIYFCTLALFPAGIHGSLAYSQDLVGVETVFTSKAIPEKSISINTGGARVDLSFSAYGTSTVDDLKEYLTSNHVYLYYQLAIPITMQIDGNEVTKDVRTISILGKCKNLLLPNSVTPLSNGISCTDNGDGTFTLNGTAIGTSDIYFSKSLSLPKGTYKFFSIENGSYSTYRGRYIFDGVGYDDLGGGVVVEFPNGVTTGSLRIIVSAGQTLNNLVIKPMIVDTSITPYATYDDFTPYTGDGKTLAQDISKINNELERNSYGEISGGKNLLNPEIFDIYNAGTVRYVSFAVPNGTYTMSTTTPVVSNVCNLFFLKGKVTTGANSANNGVSATTSRTVSTTDGYITVGYRSSETNNTNNPKDFNTQIETGSVVTDFEPYIKSNKVLMDDVNVVKFGEIAGGKNLFSFGDTFIDKTVELRPIASQRLNIQKVNNHEITCTYVAGSYNTGFLVFDGIDGTKDYAISYRVKDNNSSFTPTVSKSTSSNATSLVLGVYGNNQTQSFDSSYHFTLYDIQVEEGTTITPFEPFIKSNRTLTEDVSDIATYQSKKPTAIPSDTDITTLGAGLYYSDSSGQTANLKGLPSGLTYGFLLEVYEVGANARKFFRITGNSTSTQASNIYYKRSDSAQWTKFAGTLI